MEKKYIGAYILLLAVMRKSKRERAFKQKRHGMFVRRNKYLAYENLKSLIPSKREKRYRMFQKFVFYKFLFKK